ncbi:hypothetical protein [Natronosalvus caseinilyticus]|nr:hypothetical protein [Natronosalvus caseinilyticus]
MNRDCETTTRWPEEPAHEDAVVGGEAGKDEYPVELLADIDNVNED